MSILPLARVRKLVRLDDEVDACAPAATFLIAVATEMFVEYISEQSHNIARADKKPRKNIQYKDIANAVSRIDELEFLSDIVPKTIPYKLLEAKNKTDAGKAETEVPPISNTGLSPQRNEQ